MIQHQSLGRRLREAIQQIGARLYRRKKPLLFILLGMTVIVIVIQLWYGTTNKALPFTSLDGTNVSSWSSEEIEQFVQQKYAGLDIILKVDAKNVTMSFLEAGISPNADTISRHLVDYPVWQQFIPFTLFKSTGKIHYVTASIQENRFKEFTKQIIPLCEIPPSDASVTLRDGKLALVEAQVGRMCSYQKLKSSVDAAVITSKGIVRSVEFSNVAPRVSTKVAQGLLQQAEAVIQRPLEIQLLDTVSVPDAATIATWIGFDFESTGRKPSLTLQKGKVVEYLKTVESKIYIAPGKTLVQTLDGSETGRTVGVAGRGIDIDKSVALLEEVLVAETPNKVVVLEPARLAPSVEYNRQYTKTNTGLEVLLKDIVTKKGNFSISVRQLDGAGLRASAYSKKESFTTASTYKMFVAVAVLKRVESDQMKWSDQATGGRTVEKCFEAMIVQSENSCAEWFGEKIGWKTITGMLHGMGLSKQTTLYSANGFVSTANDEALFLEKLYRNELASPESTTKLLDLMKRQIYRAGVPVGVGGTVANKVGFLNGLLHDAAIVYTPTGTYVIVILSDGSSWREIADAARQIHAFLP